ncbi:hypothetical protein MBELCI_0395 [Limimaricola cinnabarinus LL-001]|uniref:Uncharacterized protein n=1 Tax=Limimaricola cinnabarinus LL-001 TaxID=1337093 RepID=U3AHT8_9RHOB|nr:hypothetical protein MBELCI_0395 [Limimaricola cinnabarinus LL-001]
MLLRPGRGRRDPLGERAAAGGEVLQGPAKGAGYPAGDGTAAFWRRYKAFAERAEAICR